MAKNDAKEVHQETRQTARQERIHDDNDRISNKVLMALGRPPHLIKMDVIHIHNSAYRVNVIISDRSKADIMDVLTKRIAHSYFVYEYAPNLALVASPPIEKLY